MTHKERRLLMFLLERYHKVLVNMPDQKVDMVDFKHFIDKHQLVKMVQYHDNDCDSTEREKCSEESLSAMIECESDIVGYAIEMLKKHIEAQPRLTTSEVHSFFTDRGREGHYLMFKPVEQWDEYDCNNYYSLLQKHGATRRCFTIIATDVNNEIYVLNTTDDTALIFDTEEEALDHLNTCKQKQEFQGFTLSVRSLWSFT